MVKFIGLPISLARWVVLAACVCGLFAHLLIDSLGQPLSPGSAALTAGLTQRDAHHDHFYLTVWRPAPQPVSRLALAPTGQVFHCLRIFSPLLPPPKAINPA